MYQRWQKRDPVKNYFMVPNEVFSLGLNSDEISIYNYLLRCEDRKTYQCHPSYRTIGNAVDLCENTVKKYVGELVDKRLISTENTTITTKKGVKRNGSLRYTIRPIQEAVKLYHQRQMEKLKLDTARWEAQKATQRGTSEKHCETGSEEEGGAA